MSDDDLDKPRIWLPSSLGAELRVTYTKDATQDLVRQQRAELKQLRAQIEQQQRPAYKQVYERYRRRRAKNPKITLKQVCDEMGVDYDNIRAQKSRATKHEKQKNKRHRNKPE